MSSIFIPASRYESQGMEAWQGAASKLLEAAQDRRIWCLYGDLGAGKTTCVQALCHALGVREAVRSPTFGLVHEYVTSQGAYVYHFDFYRLKNQQEAIDIGCEEYFSSGAYCFLEWPEVVASLLPDRYVDLFLSTAAEGGKKIEMVGGPRDGGLEEAGQLL